MTTDLDQMRDETGRLLSEYGNALLAQYTLATSQGQIVLEATVSAVYALVNDLTERLKQSQRDRNIARQMERIASRHCHRAETEIAEVGAKLASREAWIARQDLRWAQCSEKVTAAEHICEAIEDESTNPDLVALAKLVRTELRHALVGPMPGDETEPAAS